MRISALIRPALCAAAISMLGASAASAAPLGGLAAPAVDESHVQKVCFFGTGPCFDNPPYYYRRPVYRPYRPRYHGYRRSGYNGCGGCGGCGFGFGLGFLGGCGGGWGGYGGYGYEYGPSYPRYLNYGRP